MRSAAASVAEGFPAAGVSGQGQIHHPSGDFAMTHLKRLSQLSGFVNSQADINKAVEVARGVAGVKSVKNDMKLK